MCVQLRNKATLFSVPLLYMQLTISTGPFSLTTVGKGLIRFCHLRVSMKVLCCVDPQGLKLTNSPQSGHNPPHPQIIKPDFRHFFHSVYLNYTMELVVFGSSSQQTENATR